MTDALMNGSLVGSQHQTAGGRILLVEDNEDDAVATQHRLASIAIGSYQIDWAKSVEEGLKLAMKKPFDACLVDYRLGDSDGLRFIAGLRASGSAVPCVFLTGTGSSELDLEAMRLGAVDYLDKDALSTEVLERSVRYAIERGRCERALTLAARRDPLTQLHNRTSLYERLESSVERYQRTDRPVAILAIDLDRFKAINDSLGHHAGDIVIRTTAERLTQVVRPYDLVARVGGDEFVIVIDEFPDSVVSTDASSISADAMDWLASLADRVFSRVGAPIRVDAETVSVTPSIGIASCPKDSVQAEGLLKAADRAMYRAKRERCRTSFYDSTVDERDSEKRRPATLQQIGGGFLDLAFQPQIELGTGRVRGVEALLRWTTSSGKKLPPAECIPVFRRQGILQQVGDGVRERAAAQSHAWQQSGLATGRLAVNVSATELCEPSLPAKVEELLEQYDVKLELELTETELIHDDLRARSALARLRALGVRIAIDDFGSGFSSLQRVRMIPFDVLKIDRVFIANLEFFEPRPRDRRGDGEPYGSTRGRNSWPKASRTTASGSRSSTLGSRWRRVLGSATRCPRTSSRSGFWPATK